MAAFKYRSCQGRRQIPFWNLYADIFCSDLTSCPSLRYVLEKCLAGDLQHGHALHTKMTCEGTQDAWLALGDADKNTMKPKAKPCSCFVGL